MSKKQKGQTQVCIYPDWCKGCGLCVAFCPGKVLVLNAFGKAEVAKEEECINCGFCELHCPDFAIAIRPRARNGVVPSDQDGGWTDPDQEHGRAAPPESSPEPNPNPEE